ELENLQSEIVRNRLLGKQLEAQILDLRQSRASVGKAAQLAFETALLELKTAIDSWKNGYLLKAPVSGVMALPDSRRNGQVLAAGEVILSLVPENDHDARPYCRAWIPAADIAKLKTGMEARIRLEAYPWQQYGELEARITKLAEVAENGVFEARLSLPNGLATTNGKDLEFHHELQGTVRITTEKRSLLKRLLTNLKWE
ncbi:MAG: HlyD family efflux transporter periplasmic adaptor subunit, partial [Bacteroidetes bacterium]